MKIDISGWKDFKITDLFELHLAKGDLQPKKLENGDIPLVSAGMTNNGIVMNIKEGDGKSEKFNSNVITIDMFGKAFYQNKDFFAVSHGRVNILKPKFKLNYYIGLFLVSVFDKKLLGDFSFTKMCSQGRLQNETISLPINKYNEPDYKLIENIVKSTEQEIINIIKRHELRIRFISSIRWKKFKLRDLFKVCSSKKIFHANAIKNIYDFEKERTYPYVVRSAVNNGIRGYIKENENYLNPANTLSFAQDTFSVFYQEKPYFTGNKVKVLTPKFKGFNKISALFIVTNFKKLLVDFTWGKSSTTNSIEDITLKLPTKENKPDFELIENLMKYIQGENNPLFQMIRKIK